jgi:NAD(P)-dependent dehydrogenase (short-subunit alcohol dehydrogenase family)
MLDGKVVVVTGASRGIGKGLAIGLADLGAQVVCAARTEQASQHDLPGTIHDTVAEIQRSGGTALAVRCDIGEPTDIKHLIATTFKEFGRIDGLVNNAMSETRASFEESTIEQWDDCMRINVRSLYLLCQEVVPVMSEQDGGGIVNISSGGAAHESTPFMPPGYVVYSVAKAALERFTTAVAPELQPCGVVINALRPGAVKTERATHELGPDFDFSGWTTPERVVAPVADLLTASFTGKILDVSGHGKDWPAR